MKFSDFLAKQLKDNRNGIQSTAVVKEVERLAKLYLPEKERQKFYEESYKDSSETVYKIAGTEIKL